MSCPPTPACGQTGGCIDRGLQGDMEQILTLVIDTTLYKKHVHLDAFLTAALGDRME